MSTMLCLHTVVHCYLYMIVNISFIGDVLCLEESTMQ